MIYLDDLRYKTKPYKHQHETVQRFVDAEYGALFHEQGLGKSKEMLDIIANGPTRNILILGPNGLHLNWYFKELVEHFPNGDVSSYCWTGKPTSHPNKFRLERFLDPKHHCHMEYAHSFLFMNVEAIRTDHGFDTAWRFLKARKDTMIVIDESTCIKNPKAQVTKSAFKLATKADRRFILSGTPMTQGPLDMFSQAKFLHEKAQPYRTYTAFKACFAVEEVRFAGPRSFKAITGYRNLDHLTEIMKPFASRLRKEDCLDLPDKTWQRIIIEFTPEQKRVYNEVKEYAIAEFRSGEITSAALALTKLLRLQQICSGFVRSDTGVDVPLPCNKLKVLMQIAEANQPLVIFCAFRDNVTQISEALRKHFGDNKVVEYVGGQSSADRRAAVEKFQNAEADFIVCTSAGAMGITLTRASTMVYYSNPMKLQDRLQSQDRIHRIGQENKCTYIDLVVPGTIEDRILEILNQKKELSDLVLDDLVELM